MKYLCYGYEEAPTTGTPHLQGFVVFKCQVAKPSMFFKDPGHFEVTKGTPAQNIEYCKKTGSFQEFGQAPMTKQEQGDCEKERWRQARLAAESGNLQDVEDDIYVRYYSTLKKIKFDHAAKPADLPALENEWIHGVTGCGKSRAVRERFPDAYIKNQNKWWCGYQGEETVIIDDLHKDWTGAHALKNWADHYAFLAEVKGGVIMIRPKRIIVTSNYIPEEVFLNKNDLDPINRRFNVINMTPESDTNYAPIFNINK